MNFRNTKYYFEHKFLDFAVVQSNLISGVSVWPLQTVPTTPRRMMCILIYEPEPA